MILNNKFENVCDCIPFLLLFWPDTITIYQSLVNFCATQQRRYNQADYIDNVFFETLSASFLIEVQYKSENLDINGLI